MYNIGICDDEVQYFAQISDFVLSCAKEIEEEIKINVFSSGDDLCKYMEQNILNLIFLDIEMNNMNGIGAAHYIREQLDNQIVQIVFVTGTTQYYRQLFAVQPLEFITKPIKKEAIRESVFLGYRKFTSGGRKLMYQSEYEKKSIAQREIISLCKNGKDVEIYTRNGQNDWFRGTIKDAEKQLKGGRTLRISQSVIVNFDYIKEFRAEKIIMTNDKEYKISRALQTSVKRIYCSMTLDS